MFKFGFFLSACLITTLSLSAEVDQFTNRDQKLKDSSPILNEKANIALENSLKELNAQNSNCNEEDLYSKLRSHFGNHLKGDFTIYVIKTNELDKRHFEIKDSIYRQWNSFNGFILGNPLFKKSELALSDSIRVGDVEVGTDKFEHFFGRGFTYFTKHYLNGKSIESTLRYGANQEKLILGGLFLETGIFSYGDLSANFNGMRFWNSVLLKDDDILGSDKNIGPYVKCVDQKWVQNEKIDFTKYFDLTMDESFNCSKFSTENTVKKFNEEVKKLNASCGMDQRKLTDFQSKYGRFSSWIINTDGVKKVEYFGEFGE